MGQAYSAYHMAYPPKSLFTVDQIIIIGPDTRPKLVRLLLSLGIGRETWKVLLNRNAKVYIAARSKPKANEAIELLKSKTNGKVAIFLELDLANLASVRKAAEELKSKEQELHVLFNNAGLMSPLVEQRTVDG